MDVSQIGSPISTDERLERRLAPEVRIFGFGFPDRRLVLQLPPTGHGIVARKDPGGVGQGIEVVLERVVEVRGAPPRDARLQ